LLVERASRQALLELQAAPALLLPPPQQVNKGKPSTSLSIVDVVVVVAVVAAIAVALTAEFFEASTKLEL